MEVRLWSGLLGSIPEVPPLNNPVVTAVLLVNKQKVSREAAFNLPQDQILLPVDWLISERTEGSINYPD